MRWRVSIRTLHGPDLLADFIVRLPSTLDDKFERVRIWSPRMVVLALIVAASFGSGRNRLAWEPLLMRLRREYGDSLEWDGVPDLDSGNSGHEIPEILARAAHPARRALGALVGRVGQPTRGPRHDQHHDQPRHPPYVRYGATQRGNCRRGDTHQR